VARKRLGEYLGKHEGWTGWPRMTFAASTFRSVLEAGGLMAVTPASRTGRRTSAFSGRTRVSPPVLEERTGRATRRAADAQR